MESEQFKRGTRWEYIRMQVDANQIKNSDTAVERLGLDGWEMIDVVFTQSYIHLWFKRPLN